MTDRFTVTRTIAAPRGLIWDAWTLPEHFSVWFGTEAVEIPLDSLTMDVRVGGALIAEMVLPDGNRINWLGEYVEVDRPSRLVLTLTDEPGTDPGEPMIATFVEVAGGTEVTMSQPIGSFTAEQVQATTDGYNAFYDSLERLLATLG